MGATRPHFKLPAKFYYPERATRLHAYVLEHALLVSEFYETNIFCNSAALELPGEICIG